MVIAPGNFSTCSTPSGPMASPSWVTMKRAALPSGDISSCMPVFDVLVVETFVRDVEEVVAAGRVEIGPHIDLVVEGLVRLDGLQIGLTVGADQEPLCASVSSAVSFSWVMICGKILSMTSREVLASLISAAKLSMWSSVSNTDLNVQQMGTSKQCFSQ